MVSNAELRSKYETPQDYFMSILHVNPKLAGGLQSQAEPPAAPRRVGRPPPARPPVPLDAGTGHQKETDLVAAPPPQRTHTQR
jgi:hypothetical protein